MAECHVVTPPHSRHLRLLSPVTLIGLEESSRSLDQFDLDEGLGYPKVEPGLGQREPQSLGSDWIAERSPSPLSYGHT